MIARVPVASTDEETDAVPVPSSVAEPSVVAPSWKVTVPVGVPLPGATAVTVAVTVTDWPWTVPPPTTDAATLVVAAPTLWLPPPVEATKSASPA